MELIIVITLIVIVSGGMMPMLSVQLHKSSLDAALETLMLDLQQAQQFSLTQEDACCLTLLT